MYSAYYLRAKFESTYTTLNSTNDASSTMKRLEMADNLYFFVSSRSIRRYLDLFDETGDVSPAKYHHGPHWLLDSFEETRLIQALLDRPDIYLDEIQLELYEATGIDVSLSTICRTIKRLGFSKKNIDKLRFKEVRRRE